MDKIINIRMALLLSLIGIVSCNATPKQAVTPATPTYTHRATHPTPPKKLAENIQLQGDSIGIWRGLQSQSLSKLNTQVTITTRPTEQAWLKLAIISKQYGANTSDLLPRLMAWRDTYPNHPGNSLFPENNKLKYLTLVKPQKHIALLLPLKGPLGAQGQAVRDGYLSAYYDALTDNNHKQTITFYDTSSANLNLVYQQAIAKGANVIIGPLTKPQVQQLSTQGTYPVTTLALNYIEQNTADPHFYQFGLSQRDEAEQLAEKAFQSGKSRAIIIASGETWGRNIANTLTQHWEAQGGKIIDSYYYPTRPHFSQDIAKLMHINPTEDRAQMNDDNTKSVLQKQRRQDFDTIFLIALPQQGRDIVPLLKYYYADDTPIYSTSIIYTGSPTPQKDADLNGVIFCDIPWVLNKPSKSQHNRLYAVGRDAELLSNELERLAILPHFPLPAATGSLSLNTKQQIYRQVPWTQMHAGHP
jgi:outer membrane PBP1 activator LpoA protein